MGYTTGQLPEADAAVLAAATRLQIELEANSNGNYYRLPLETLQEYLTCGGGCTDWQPMTNQDLNSNPVPITVLPTPIAGKIIMPTFLLWAMDYNSVVYDFGGNPFIATASAPTTSIGGIPLSTFNSNSDKYWVTPINGGVLDGGGFVFGCSADATQGNSTYYIKIFYKLIDAPF